MKLKIHSKWKWLALDDDGGLSSVSLHTHKPKLKRGIFYKNRKKGEMLHTLCTFTRKKLTPGTLYKRNGDNWEEVEK